MALVGLVHLEFPVCLVAVQPLILSGAHHPLDVFDMLTDPGQLAIGVFAEEGAEISFKFEGDIVEEVLFAGKGFILLLR